MVDATEAFLPWISDSGSSDLQTRRISGVSFCTAALRQRVFNTLRPLRSRGS